MMDVQKMLIRFFVHRTKTTYTRWGINKLTDTIYNLPLLLYLIIALSVPDSLFEIQNKD